MSSILAISSPQSSKHLICDFGAYTTTRSNESHPSNGSKSTYRIDEGMIISVSSSQLMKMLRARAPTPSGMMKEPLGRFNCTLTSL